MPNLYGLHGRAMQTSLRSQDVHFVRQDVVESQRWRFVGFWGQKQVLMSFWPERDTLIVECGSRLRLHGDDKKVVSWRVREERGQTSGQELTVKHFGSGEISNWKYAWEEGVWEEKDDLLQKH